MYTMEQCDKQRVNVLKRYVVGWIVLVIGVLGMFSNGIFLMLVIAGVILLLINECVFAKKFKQQYKECIVSMALQELFDLKVYKPNEGLDEDFVKNTCFIETGSIYKSDDYVDAYYHGVHFTRADVLTQKVVSNGKTTTTVTLFEGTWTTFDLPKKIDSYMLLREKEFLGGGKPGGWFKSVPNTTKVTFEDVAFHKKFEVYAENEHDAFYLMSPVFLQCIKRLENVIEGRLFLGVMDHKLHVMFHTEDNMMEPSLWKIIDQQDVESVKQNLQYIIKIIEALDLEYAGG